MADVGVDPPPVLLGHILAWWAELSAARPAGMSGPSPIGYGEIEAWARLSGRQPRPWEIALLRKVDDAYVRSFLDG